MSTESYMNGPLGIVGQAEYNDCPDMNCPCHRQEGANMQEINKEDFTKRKVVKGPWNAQNANYQYFLMVWDPRAIDQLNPNGKWIQFNTGNKEWADKTIKHYKLKAVSK